MVIATAENKFDFTDINFTLYEINEHYLCIYKDLVKIKSNENKLTLKNIIFLLRICLNYL